MDGQTLETTAEEERVAAEQIGVPAAAPPSVVHAAHDGDSQWKLIWREFSKRRMAVVSAWVIFLLIQTSIWAPFLANDRPLYYRGANVSRYAQSVQTCQGALAQLTEARRKSAAPPVDVQNALNLHLGLMRSSLSAEDGQRLADWKSKLQTALTETNSAAAIKQFGELRKALRETFAARKVTLVPQSAWPVLASLHWLDVFFMVWSLTTVLSLLWRRWTWAPKLRTIAFSPALIHVGIWLGIPLITALAWKGFIPPREDQTPYKQGRLAGQTDDEKANASVLYSTVLWPPVPYGLSESVLEKKNQAPPWWPNRSEPGASAANAQLKMSVAPKTPWDTPHWLGTDALGRDVLSRTIWGGRVSLSVGIVSVSIYVALGILIGATAGYFRGLTDLLISRLIEIVICFPAFFLILTIVALRGPSIWNIMIVIGLTGWTGVARLIRAEFLRLVDQEFVLAGRALGYSPARLIFRHVLPNALAPVLVSATFGVAGAILTESALSYLGLGITIPIPSWGSLLLDGRTSEGVAPWLIVLPGLAIFITITCYNLVGEALRDASDPRLRGSRA